MSEDIAGSVKAALDAYLPARITTHNRSCLHAHKIAGILGLPQTQAVCDELRKQLRAFGGGALRAGSGTFSFPVDRGGR